MGLKSKTRLAERRKKEKRSRKTINTAKYAAMRDQGINQKSKRFRLNAKRVKSLRSVKHALGPCGNIGCRACSKVAQLVYERKQDFWRSISA